VAREKPLDLTVVQEWLSAWNESDVFSDAAVRHLQSLIIDPFCLVVVTLGVGHEPRSLVFRRIKWMIPVPISRRPAPKATLRFAKPEELISQFPAMHVSPVAPAAPSVGQLWHQIGVRYWVSGSLSELERVLQWDGKDWVIAGYVLDTPTIMKQGIQACYFQEALACAHGHTKWLDCEFIYTYDGSTWGNA
jgi:hypothetical protein